jgi:hypothetical protein
MFDRSVLEQYFCSEVFGSTVASRLLSFRVSSDRRLKGLSRVRGNSHARFLEGWAGAIPPGYSTRSWFKNLQESRHHQISELVF